MSINWGEFDVSSLNGYSNNLNLNGLDIFKKRLEKYFFGQVGIRKCNTSNIEEIKLVIEVSCPHALSFFVDYYRTSVISNTGDNTILFYNILKDLQSVNLVCIDIEELSIITEDTSIFIQQINNFSVARQYDNILRQVVISYKYIISHLKEIPKEIHVPVLVENKKTKPKLISEFFNSISDQHYFNYWGLCYDSHLDTIIFDLEKSEFIFDDLLYLPE